MYEVFSLVCYNFENSDSELHTVDEMLDNMKSLCDDPDQVYSYTYMKKKLQDRYGDDLFFADLCGRRNVLCFRNTAKRLINDKWYSDRDSDITKESERIVETAAKLIKDSIREATYDTDFYPSDCDIQNKGLMSDWVPSLLKIFLSKLVCDDVKKISLGHCIVQASRPRSVIAPVLFGVGVSVDHKVGATGLLQMLSRLGLSVSPDEIIRFKQSVVQMDDDGLPASGSEYFTQWSGDNVDHNVATVDGLGTFHGMGIISMTVKKSSLKTDIPQTSVDILRTGDLKLVKRLARVKVASIVQGRNVNMHIYSPPNVPPLSQLTFLPIIALHYPHTLPTSSNLDLIWNVGWYFRGVDDPRPNWSGFMQKTNMGEHSSPADIRMQPIIDHNPGDRSCILSTLYFK